MFDTVTATLKGARTVPLVETVILRGYDLRGSQFQLEVRDRRDGGFLRIEVGTAVDANSEGVSVSDYYVLGGVIHTVLTIRIGELKMQALPDAPEPGDDMELTWGLIITPVTGVNDDFLAFEGPFIVKASTPA